MISPVLCPENIIYKNSELNGDIIFPIKKQDSEGFKIFPNPFNGILNISGLDIQDKNLIKIYNYLGEAVYSYVAVPDQPSIKLNLNDLKAGSYIISIENKKSTITKAIFLSR